MKKLTNTIFAAAAMTLALSASAATVTLPTITTNVAHDVEINDGDLSFAKFNATLGTLTSVKFELFSNVSGYIDVSNDAQIGANSTFTVTTGGQLDSLVNGTTLSILSSTTKVFNLAPTASSHLDLTPWTDTNVSIFSAPANLSAFIGSGNYHAMLSGWSQDNLEGTGNASYLTHIVMDGQAKVTYTYETLPVPEPETYAMLLAGLGLMGVVARRRKSV